MISSPRTSVCWCVATCAVRWATTTWLSPATSCPAIAHVLAVDDDRLGRGDGDGARGQVGAGRVRDDGPVRAARVQTRMRGPNGRSGARAASKPPPAAAAPGPAAGSAARSWVRRASMLAVRVFVTMTNTPSGDHSVHAATTAVAASATRIDAARTSRRGAAHVSSSR